ncbi:MULTISPECIES: tyrosine-protein phosphatase [Paenibacillus]|uniref:Tyrosine-protein phosphatase n=1 Tax=Paenibacillus amylolyticus TaxID=1451 RepID=A0ABD8AW86_PAEAM
MNQDLMHRINLRELGGYPVNQGKKVVKTNHLYRSGEISDLSLEDIRYLQNLGLSFICDLRSKEEQEQHPNPPIEGVEMFSNPALGGAVAVQSLDQLLPALMNHRLTEDPLLGVYKQFVTDEQSKQAYRLLIRTILQSGGRPVLWHCTAGKDRTGFASAIILLLLDAPLETIMEDYMKSSQYRQEANRKWIDQIKEVVQNPEHVSLIQSFMGIKPEYLRAAIDEIVRVYGSTDNYLLEGLGVSDLEREQLQAWYLIEQEAGE